MPTIEQYIQLIKDEDKGLKEIDLSGLENTPENALQLKKFVDYLKTVKIWPEHLTIIRIAGWSVGNDPDAQPVNVITLIKKLPNNIKVEVGSIYSESSQEEKLKRSGRQRAATVSGSSSTTSSDFFAPLEPTRGGSKLRERPDSQCKQEELKPKFESTTKSPGRGRGQVVSKLSLEDACKKRDEQLQRQSHNNPLGKQPKKEKQSSAANKRFLARIEELGGKASSSDTIGVIVPEQKGVVRKTHEHLTEDSSLPDPSPGSGNINSKKSANSLSQSEDSSKLGNNPPVRSPSPQR